MEETTAPLASRYFVGVPAPAAAALAVLPMSLSFVFGDTWLRSDLLNVVTLVGVAILMISRFPTFSAKRLKLRAPQRLFALVGLVVFIALLMSETWIVVSLVTLVYLASIPVSVIHHRRELQQGGTLEPEEPVLPEDDV